jgi:hypothetical protein
MLPIIGTKRGKEEALILCGSPQICERRAVKEKMKKASETFNASDFSLRIPKDFVGRSEINPDGKGGYAEFFKSSGKSEDSGSGAVCFFCYWKKLDDRLDEHIAKSLVDEVCRLRVFSADHILEITESWPITFKRLPAFLMKGSFVHVDPKAEGQISFYVINNVRPKQVCLLGALVEHTGTRWRDAETLNRIEDGIISSVRFRKSSESRNEKPPKN